ncbi:PREDICTED: angiopoietin-2-like [Branchiostoma belcheri]|uniref:Angiopoietin-2-like n=1 Tax=Branchiostoma belcheri TaxID=7741 RepID=A0A6P4ZJP7_BRABE|nr:PREDICTED: angiopoietin-2-like [Branchiostoma belcheri]
MFRTTFYRLTFAIVIVGIMMSMVVMTMIILKTISTSKAQPHRPSHWPTPLEESSVSSTMSAESTTEATMMLPTEQSTAMPLNTTMAMVHRGLDETESPGKGNHTCAPGKCRDCAEIYEGGSTTSGVYLVTLQNNTPVEVYCDMDTNGGGWTVIQRRIDGTVPFNRNWEEYKRGFGNKDGEHWLGNDNIHLLTNQKDYRLQLFTNNMALTCSRGFFKVSDERNDYRPDHGKGKPNSNCDRLIKDTFGQAFSTVDRDNDNVQTISCAKLYGGGWWYGYCGPTTFLNQQWDCARNPKCCPCPITVKPMSLKLKP